MPLRSWKKSHPKWDVGLPSSSRTGAWSLTPFLALALVRYTSQIRRSAPRNS